MRNMSLQQTNRILKTCILQSRLLSSAASDNNDISPIFTNRNPRNLEKLRIAYKPEGYHVDKEGRSFWHKLQLCVSGRYVTATVTHFQNGDVLEASTREWALKKQLYRGSDTAAYINLGRVLAQRCLESGITEMRCDIKPTKEDGKISQLLKSLADNGISLTESEQYKAPHPWDQYRPEKPWEVVE